VRNLVLFVVAAIFAIAAVSPASAQTFTTLYTFYGSNPFGGLVADRNDNYYGTTAAGGEYYYGMVFELSPPTVAWGGWTETVIWNFAGYGYGDGAGPAYQLLIDEEGNLYGETRQGGIYDSGTVFLLAPPKTSGGSWTKRILYLPTGGEEVFFGELLRDSAGALYGTQFSSGTFDEGLAFKLTPGPNGEFRATTLYSFGATTADSAWPYGPLTMDMAGNLYGVSYGGGANKFGTAYKLTAPATEGGLWSNSVLYSFGEGEQGCIPEGNVVLDRSGRLYGLTSGCGALGNGVFFQLTPTESGPWLESILHAFSSTDGGGGSPSLALDTHANVFYGTSYYAGGFGVAYQIAPPVTRGGAWTDTVLHSFSGGSDGAYPVGPIVWDANGVLYSTSYSTAFSITP
jgi:hypothetical protein